MLILAVILIASYLLPASECAAHNSTGLTLNKELVLTPQEKVAFEQFKSAVYKNISDNLLIMRQDLYLLRFLRAKNLDVEVAKRDLLAVRNQTELTLPFEIISIYKYTFF